MTKEANGWFLRIVAGALVTATLAWGAMVTSASLTHEVRIGQLEKQYQRIEEKLDRLLDIFDTSHIPRR